MTRLEILKKISEIFEDVLDIENIAITELTTASDVEGWDSLNHINIMVHVQKEFNVKFNLKEMASFKNIGDMISAIEEKLS